MLGTVISLGPSSHFPHRRSCESPDLKMEMPENEIELNASGRSLGLRCQRRFSLSPDDKLLSETIIDSGRPSTGSTRPRLPQRTFPNPRMSPERWSLHVLLRPYNAKHAVDLFVHRWQARVAVVADRARARCLSHNWPSVDRQLTDGDRSAPMVTRRYWPGRSPAVHQGALASTSSAWRVTTPGVDVEVS